jgi:hypothetical protein
MSTPVMIELVVPEVTYFYNTMIIDRLFNILSLCSSNAECCKLHLIR